MIESRLDGLSVLVIEDDYYQADDTRRLLEEAGAQVIGPFADGTGALKDPRRIECALLDLNLGAGPNFATARDLRQRGVPVVFVTGYDDQTIPGDLASVVCLQKPVSPDRVIDAVAHAVRP